MTLPDEDRRRHARQLEIPGWGEPAQERVRGASAIVVGAGSLGAPAAAHLAAAGVGRVGIVDSAPVSVSSLHRQTLQFTPEVGANRAESTALKLALIDPEVQAEPYPVALEGMNAAAIVAGADVALDCSGADATRLLVNDACCSERVPFVVAGVAGLSGFLMSVVPGGSACHRCALAAPTGAPGDDAGSLGAVGGAVGALQALEALKLLTGAGRPLLDRVLRLDGADLGVTVEPVDRRPGCPACGDVPPAGQSG